MKHESFEESSKYTEAEKLSDQLQNAGIDLAAWGQGPAKTVDHLLSEIREGESDVVFDEEGQVSRHVRVAWVDVLFFDAAGNVYQLYEDRQEYNDGRTRRRQLSSSIGEKFKPQEKPLDAAIRALDEELGIKTFEALHAIGSEATIHTPDSYPGLTSHYDTHSFVAVVGQESYNPEGYVEVQADKVNYYAWKCIRPAAAD